MSLISAKGGARVLHILDAMNLMGNVHLMGEVVRLRRELSELEKRLAEVEERGNGKNRRWVGLAIREVFVRRCFPEAQDSRLLFDLSIVAKRELRDPGRRHNLCLSHVEDILSIVIKAYKPSVSRCV